MLVATLVRMAMEKMCDGSGVTVRVGLGNGKRWNQFFERQSGVVHPEVVEDAALSDKDCVLETELGSANFGLEAQLKEVEQGFFDLLALRPVTHEPTVLAPYMHHLEAGSTLRWKGRINQVVGNLIESEGPFCSVGESCEIVGAGGRVYAGEIIGFRGSTMLSMAADNPQGIRFGDQIMTWGARPSVRVGPELLGRVIDPTGNPLDGKGDYAPPMESASMVQLHCLLSAFPFASRLAAAFERLMAL